MQNLLLGCTFLPIDATTDFVAAATVYRRCRRQGVTPRGLNDCLIAAVAWRRGAVLLAQDADMSRIAAVLGLELDAADLPPGAPQG